jgi:hypothetical protein
MTKRPYIDPHLDPMRSPSRAGQHPHLVPEGPSKRNPQGMYEFRQRHDMTYQPGPRPVGQPPPPQKPGLLDNPLVLLGLGAVAAYFLMSRRSDEDAPRQNPEPVAAPPPQSFVVVAPGAQPVPVYTAMPAGAAAPEQKLLPAPQPAPAVSVDPMPEVQEALSAVAEKVVEKAQDKAVDTTVKTAKKEYVRVTTQARDPVTGAFLSAGTAKPRIEGALTAEELRAKAKKKLEDARKKARSKKRRRRR